MGYLTPLGLGGCRPVALMANDPTSWSTIMGRCRALSRTRAAGCDGVRFAWVACVSYRNRRGAGQLLWTGKGCACIKGSIFKLGPMPSFPVHPSSFF